MLMPCCEINFKKDILLQVTLLAWIPVYVDILCSFVMFLGR